MEKINFKNSRGLNLVGDFYKADSNKGIILLHGFTGDRHENGIFDILAKKLHENFFNVLALDFSGSGESDDEPLNTDNQAQDLRDAIDFFSGKGVQNIGVVGMSLGPISIIKNKNLFGNSIKAVVLLAPVTSKKDNYVLYKFSEEHKKQLEQKGIIIYLKSVHRRPRNRFEISKQLIEERGNLNQKDFLSNISIPILIIHGSKDKVIPLNWSEKAMEILPKGSELKVLEGEGHTFENKREELAKETVKWFGEHLN